jgi:hypothetical protein
MGLFAQPGDKRPQEARVDGGHVGVKGCGCVYDGIERPDRRQPCGRALQVARCNTTSGIPQPGGGYGASCKRNRRMTTTTQCAHDA